MRMLNVNLSAIVGISGDFNDEVLWPEFTNTDIIQQSAHSEIDFESLLSTFGLPPSFIICDDKSLIVSSSF